MHNYMYMYMYIYVHIVALLDGKGYFVAPYVGEVCSLIACLAVSGVCESVRGDGIVLPLQLLTYQSRNPGMEVISISHVLSMYMYIHVHGYLMHSTSHLY